MGHSRRLLNSPQVVRLSDVTVSVANADREYGTNLFYRFNVSDRIRGCVRAPYLSRRMAVDRRLDRRRVYLCGGGVHKRVSVQKSQIASRAIAVRQLKTILARTLLNDCREPGIKRGLNPAGVL